MNRIMPSYTLMKLFNKLIFCNTLFLVINFSKPKIVYFQAYSIYFLVIHMHIQYVIEIVNQVYCTQVVLCDVPDD